MFPWKEDYFLVDVNSGAVHVLDQAAYLFINHLIEARGDYEQVRQQLGPQLPASMLDEIWREMNALHRQGALFTEMEPVRVDTAGLVLKALCLNVAHLCNMSCGYCFAAQGDFGMKPGLMSLEIARQAVDFLIEHSQGRKHLEIDFFGGEPLLVADMLKELVKYCRSLEPVHNKEFAFTLTTNALLLDDTIINWVTDNNIGVILSLDGRQTVHDQYRPLKNGSGSYATVVPKIKAMVAAGPVSYYVRGTFTRQNLDFAEDCRHLLELGFFSVSLEPAVGPENEYSIRPADLPIVKQEYERLTEVLIEYAKKGAAVDFYHFNLDMQQGPCLAKRLTGCGAGVEYLTVTPEGDLYPCHQLVGEAGFLMGNVKRGYGDVSIKQSFAACQVHDKECSRCWARYYCGGGCLAQAYYRNGDLKKPHMLSCEMHRKRVEASIYLDYYRRSGKI
ncbi:MAG: thioether cross-link-forming SCIFF peptide maturase [Syntrophomonadaceae bacterium]